MYPTVIFRKRPIDDLPIEHGVFFHSYVKLGLLGGQGRFLGKSLGLLGVSSHLVSGLQPQFYMG